jgi:hypothetical protein
MKNSGILIVVVVGSTLAVSSFKDSKFVELIIQIDFGPI